MPKFYGRKIEYSTYDGHSPDDPSGKLADLRQREYNNPDLRKKITK
ncbi:MAG: hypothetical protein JNL75_01610 [Chitinophagales bacterium]|nr:hypothetical protein [Chitinophagales bacterium]